MDDKEIKDKMNGLSAGEGYRRIRYKNALIWDVVFVACVFVLIAFGVRFLVA